MSAKILSPCIGVCTLDPASRTCIGCLRTADEIARWSEMPPAERVQVMLQLRLRRHAHGMAGLGGKKKMRGLGMMKGMMK